jgi:hypothetical protein
MSTPRARASAAAPPPRAATPTAPLPLATFHGDTAADVPVRTVRLLARPTVELHDYVYTDADKARKAFDAMERFGVRRLASDVPDFAGRRDEWAACHVDQPVYAPGDVVRGQLVLRLARKRVVRVVRLLVSCAETTLVKYTVHHNHGQHRTVEHHFHGALAKRVSEMLPVFDAQSELAATLKPGFHVYDFAFRLPAKGPGSSYVRIGGASADEGTLAHISWALSVKLGSGNEDLFSSQGLRVQGVPAAASAEALVLATTPPGATDNGAPAHGAVDGAAAGISASIDVGGGGGGGVPSGRFMSAEGGVTACCCLGRGRAAVTAEVIGDVVAGAPLRVRVMVDNSGGSAAVTVKLRLGRMLLLHTGIAAQVAAVRATEAGADIDRDKTGSASKHAVGAPAAAPAASAIAGGSAGVWAGELANKRGFWGIVQDELADVEAGEVEAGATARFDSDAIKLPADSAATGAGGMLAFFEIELCVVVSSSACGSNSVAAYMALRPGFARPALWGLMGPGAGNAAEATFLKCGEHGIGGAGSAGPALATYPPLAESLMAASARSGASK